MAWPYSKYFFSEPLSGLCLLAAAYFLLTEASGSPGSRSLARTALSGFFLGLAVATRFANAVLVPIYLIPLLGQHARAQRVSGRSFSASRCVLLRALQEVVAFGVPLLVWAVLICGYNYVRFANPFTTGYLPEESFSAPWLTGILGLLVSPGRGLVFFCPVLVLCLLTSTVFFRRHRVEAALVFLVSACYVLLYGKWFMWHGGYAWGPRFLVPILPLLCLTLAPLLESWRGVRRWVFRALFALSAAIQLLASSVDFSLHQAALLETGIPLFDPITFFDPRYSQLWGTLSFLKPENLDFAWIQSEPLVRVDVLALTMGILLVALSAVGLVLALRPPTSTRQRQALVLVVLPLLVIAGTALSLSWYKDGSHADYVQMLEFLNLNSQPGDAVIQNSPTHTALFQSQYKGRLPTYGTFEGEQPLSSDTEALLEGLANTSSRFWLVPEGLPPQLSSLDRWFTDRGWSPTHYSFGDERLTLYTRP
jgi:hypothetical protein